METAKIFENGRSQAVRLPKKFRFNADEVIVQQLGDAVLLVPKESLWQTFMDGVNSFTSDIFEDGRDQGVQEDREDLKAGKGVEQVSGGVGRRTLHFLHHSGRVGVWDETQL